MDSETGQWEEIFKQGQYVYGEPRLQVVRFADMLIQRGLKSVLDLGCGTGRHVAYLAERGIQANGFDNAPTGLKQTKELLETKHVQATLALGDMRSPLPYKTGAFDAVLSTQVIHHARLATVIATANEIQRVVRKGGYILISVPRLKGILEDATGYNEIEPNTFVPLDGPEAGLPHHLFSPDGLRGIFPQFETIDLQIFDDRIIALTAIKKQD
jgi:SAM-dependent methyltransferase